MALTVGNVKTVLDRLRSHALTLGVFERVDGAEPKTTPLAGASMTAAFWVSSIRPAAVSSGLAETAVVVTCTGRIYGNSQYEPQDAIDPAMSDVVVLLMTALHADFELGGIATAIDLLGRHGTALNADAGYIPYDDGATQLRVFTLTIPVIFASAWTQTP